ncbi:MAG: CsbD family protein [Gemmatimonadota bacterium]
MNNDIISGNWKELKGRVREKWGQLTDDDLDRVNGKREQLVGVIQQKYGHAKDAVERDVLNFEKDAGDWLDQQRIERARDDDAVRR